MSIWAIIPVKSLHESKRRLAHLLAAEERAALMQQFLRGVLQVLSEVEAIDQTLVISSDPRVWRLAQAYGALVEKEESAHGLNAAVTHAVSLAVARGATGTLILPADLPFLQAADVGMMLAAVAVARPCPTGAAVWPQAPHVLANAHAHDSHATEDQRPQLVICSDREGDGSNGLLLYPPGAFTFHYGPGSFQQHLAEAQRRDMIVCTVDAPGLQFDLDTEADWLAYQLLTR